MENKDRIDISLTGEKSHTVYIPKGQGSISIGTEGISEGKHDIWVEKDVPINWDAFNGFYVPYTQLHNPEHYPYGDWPRFMYYSGNDKGFIDWSSKRHIEEFHWIPKENSDLDLTKANIRRFLLHAEKYKINMSIGDTIQSLFLSGHLENIDIKKCIKVPFLNFSSFGLPTASVPYQLPVYKTLENLTYVDVTSLPVGQAFDCESLLQFQNLTGLNLSGNLANLDALAGLRHLEGIGLRYVRDLTGMPKLRTWRNLKHFIGWNIEETAGKILRAELKELKKEKDMDYSTVSKLRKAIWFMTEYGIPFSSWETKTAKIATKAYKACLKDIKKLETESEVHKTLIEFIGAINKLPGIETSEREDVAAAVEQLIKSSALEISLETGNRWFDESRNF